MTKVDSGLIQTIRSLHREHRGLQKIRGDMDRKIKAEGRWWASRFEIDAGREVDYENMPEVTPEALAKVKETRVRYFQARDFLEGIRKETYSDLLKASAQLPGAEWVQSIRGLSLGSLGAIVGEAGDLTAYHSVAALWKRFGLHVLDDGTAPRRVRGVTDEAGNKLGIGYSPRRRAEMHVIGDSFVKSAGPFRRVYDQRKQYEQDRAIANGLAIVPGARITAENRATSISEGQIHARALRYTEKRLLKILWQLWNGQAIDFDTTPMDSALPAPVETVDGYWRNLGLGARAVNVLKKLEITTVEALRAFPISEIEGMAGVGAATLREIRVLVDYWRDPKSADKPIETKEDVAVAVPQFDLTF